MNPTLVVNIVLAVAAVGSMIFAVWAARSSRRSADAAEAVLGIEKERRAEEREAAAKAAQQARRAVLHAGLANSEELVIRNTGQCRAKAVKLTLEADELGRQAPQLLFDDAREIGPGVDEGWKILTHLGSAASIAVRMEWTDDEGGHEDRQLVHI